MGIPHDRSQDRRAVVLYHYLYPDHVVSSVLLSELCASLAENGWKVTGISCSRGCRDEAVVYPRQEEWAGTIIKRLWRPAWPQAKGWGRLLNSLWMIAAWSLEAFKAKQAPHVVVIGTDPVLSVLSALVWKFRFPSVKIAHWCHDLYPEAAVADGLIGQKSLLLKPLQALLRKAYAKCEVVADIGSCMRDRLLSYGAPGRHVTLTPWALEEPERALEIDVEERERVFEDTRLAFLYSGNFGRAHSSKEILELVGRLAESGAKLALSVSGNRVDELRRQVHRSEVKIVRLAPPDRLGARLSCADIHVVSLRPEWTGTVVPSKFFGALAAGRPVLFAGSEDSAIARWIRQYHVGWVLTPETMPAVEAELKELADHPERFRPLFRHCHAVYHQNFARSLVLDRWHRLLLDPACELEHEVAETR